MSLSIESRKILSKIPDTYKIKDKPKTISEIQQWACLKIFLEKDINREGKYNKIL
jgi:hypothetical protein